MTTPADRTTSAPRPPDRADEGGVTPRAAFTLVLGAWLIASPATLGYTSQTMVWSDLITGALIVFFGVLALSQRFDLARWGQCAAGLWLLFAPLVFWAPDAAAYTNNTLVGALVIGSSVLGPTMPGRGHREVMARPGPDIPPGWSYNPSDLLQRGPIIGMALVAFFVARYLAAYQLGHVPHPWDPFFGDGTRRVLDSEVSQAFPISDAGLGATAYLIEALAGFMGAANRWRTMPWMVGMFGLLIIPVGIVSIVLVILQPVAVGAWCMLCLVTAIAMLFMIAPALDEVVAMGQFVLAARRGGQSTWRVFWMGGTIAQPPEVVSRATPATRRTLKREVLSALDLNHVPWNMVAAAAIGLWIMASPPVLGAGGAAANSNYVTGALVVTFSVIAFGEIARPVRLLNVPFGLWLIAASWLFAGGTDAVMWSNTVAGVALIALAFRRGRVEARFAGWNRFLV